MNSNDLSHYVEKLKKHEFFLDESSDIQYFSYPLINQHELDDMLSEFNINEIAKGTGCFEKTISLMDWVHNELFMPGHNVTPEKNNTRAIMSVRKTGALFCWFQAIVLAELLLSIKIRTRIVSCLPQTFDYDCHVAVIVFDEATSRWFFVDPTFNTFFYSEEDGRPLDIFEIRQSYVEGRQLFRHITIDKQWTLVCNGIICETYDEWYSLYMAKNMFRFMSPASMYYSCLSESNVEYIAINPLDYEERNQYDDNKLIRYINSKSDFLSSRF